jgi:thioredoxin 1
MVEGVRKPAEHMVVKVFGKRYPTVAGTRGGKIMRIETRSRNGNMCEGVRHVAHGKLVLCIFLLLATLTLCAACSENQVADSRLDDALASGKPTLAGFVGQVCACKNITPILEELAVEYDGRCNVLVLDVSDYKSLFSEYDVTLVPTQVYFDGSGAETERIVGSSTREEMVDRLTSMGVE